MKVKVLKRGEQPVQTSSESIAKAIARIKKKGRQHDVRCKLVRGVSLINNFDPF